MNPKFLCTSFIPEDDSKVVSQFNEKYLILFDADCWYDKKKVNQEPTAKWAMLTFSVHCEHLKSN